MSVDKAMWDLQDEMDEMPNDIPCKICRNKYSKYTLHWVYDELRSEARGPYCGECFVFVQKVHKNHNEILNDS